MDIVSIIAITSSTIITLVNIIAPIIKSSQDNRYTRIQNELQLFYENKVNAYKDVCDQFGTVNIDATTYNVKNFSMSVSKAILFANNEVKEKLLSIIGILGNYFYDQKESLKMLKDIYPELTKLFANDLSKTYKSINRKSKYLK